MEGKRLRSRLQWLDVKRGTARMDDGTTLDTLKPKALKELQTPQLQLSALNSEIHLENEAACGSWKETMVILEGGKNLSKINVLLDESNMASNVPAFEEEG